MAELLPCPFCGKAVDMLGGTQAQELFSAWCKTPNCAGRGVELRIDHEASVNDWNTRAALAAEEGKP